MSNEPSSPEPALAVDLASGWPGGSKGSFPAELKQRIWFTLGALLVYRLGTYIPIPGLDPEILAIVFQQHSSGSPPINGYYFYIPLSRMAIFALGLMPYIWAAIAMLLLTTVLRPLKALKKAGAAGRRKINQYTRYGTLVLCVFQAYGVAVGLERMGFRVVIDPGLFFRFTTMVTLTGGTIFLMWLGEQITRRGVGNGIALILFAGIVANLPSAIAATLELGRTGALPGGLVPTLAVLSVAVIAFIVFMERAQRRVIVQYAKRQVGSKIFGGEASHLPLKLNTAGVIPPVFALTLLLLPLTVAGFSGGNGPEWLIWVFDNLGHGQPAYLAFYIAMIVLFAFFYTAIVFNPVEIANNLEKHAGFIPGIRPGKNTADYLDRVQTRLTVIGAAYLALICVLPEVLISRFAVPFYFGGIGFLIVVTVAMDTIGQIHWHRYEGQIRKSKPKDPPD